MIVTKEHVVERSRLSDGKVTSSKYLVIGRSVNFPVTWSGVKERWSEMSKGRRVVAVSAIAVLAVVVVF